MHYFDDRYSLCSNVRFALKSHQRERQCACVCVSECVDAMRGKWGRGGRGEQNKKKWREDTVKEDYLEK